MERGATIYDGKRERQIQLDCRRLYWWQIEPGNEPGTKITKRCKDARSFPMSPSRFPYAGFSLRITLVDRAAFTSVSVLLPDQLSRCENFQIWRGMGEMRRIARDDALRPFAARES